MLGFLVLCAAAFSVTTAAVDTFEACERRGLELVSIYSQTEENAIELALGNNTNGIGHGFWTAGSSLGSAFAWFTTGSALSYKNFPPGQPDNPNTEKCIELFRLANGTWKWNNYVCNAELPYICQTKPNCCYFN
ncbi:hypothetical protein YQE_07658, partial [Dendroctonus ponderosae]